MAEIRESDLPGIGRKFTIDTDDGDNMVIVIHDDGKREVFHFDADDPEEYLSMITLEDHEARQVAGILGGLSYMPKDLATTEITLKDLCIEWYKVKKNDSFVGKSIADTNFRQNIGVTVIAVIEKNHQQTINPGPDYIFPPESTIVIVGERKNIKAFKKYIQDGGK